MCGFFKPVYRNSIHCLALFGYPSVIFDQFILETDLTCTNRAKVCLKSKVTCFITHLTYFFWHTFFEILNTKSLIASYKESFYSSFLFLNADILVKISNSVSGDHLISVPNFLSVHLAGHYRQYRFISLSF